MSNTSVFSKSEPKLTNSMPKLKHAVHLLAYQRRVDQTTGDVIWRRLCQRRDGGPLGRIIPMAWGTGNYAGGTKETDFPRPPSKDARLQAHFAHFREMHAGSNRAFHRERAWCAFEREMNKELPGLLHRYGRDDFIDLSQGAPFLTLRANDIPELVSPLLLIHPLPEVLPFDVKEGLGSVLLHAQEYRELVEIGRAAPISAEMHEIAYNWARIEACLWQLDTQDGGSTLPLPAHVQMLLDVRESPLPYRRPGVIHDSLRLLERTRARWEAARAANARQRVA